MQDGERAGVKEASGRVDDWAAEPGCLGDFRAGGDQCLKGLVQITAICQSMQSNSRNKAGS